MSQYNYEYEVGDIFEGSPMLIQKYMSDILRLGGRFKYDGKKIIVTEFPSKDKKESDDQ